MTDIETTPAETQKETKPSPEEVHSDEEDGHKENGNSHKEGGEEGGEYDDNNDLASNKDDVDAPTPIGVVPDISNLSIKHPLQNCWALWYDNPGKKTSVSSWGEHLKKVTSFDTVIN